MSRRALGCREAGRDGEVNFGYGELGVGSVVMSTRHLETKTNVLKRSWPEVWIWEVSV